MSKYLAFTEVVFKDRELLVGALEDVGCKQVRQGEGLAMGRYYAEQIEQRAEIVVPRYSVGNDYGDIGFARSEGGEYMPVMDELDRKRALDGRFIPQLRAAYNERAVAKVATRLRGTVQRSVEGGIVKIKVRH